MISSQQTSTQSSACLPAMMCERDSCHQSNALSREISGEMYKCQASSYEEQTKRQATTQFHHSTKKQQTITNVNMLQQHPEQEIHHNHIQQMSCPMLGEGYNCHMQGAQSVMGQATTTPLPMSNNKDCNATPQPNPPEGPPKTNGSSTYSSSMLSPPLSPSSSPPSIGVNLRVTGQCSQGGRKYMEDYFSVAYQQSHYTKDLEYAFFGIYDGHGGTEAATFAKKHLMMEIINQKLFWSDSDQDVLRAIREGFIATHYAMWREQEKWPKTANGLLSTAGTTATIAFIRREKIYIGHVGDSGIVLGYQNENETFWRAKQLTTDHKPESLAERTRILRSGGKVVVKSGVPRVVWNRPRNAGHKGPIRRNTPVDEVPFLAVARSLGDLWSYNSIRNEFVVSPDPDVKVIKINPKTFRCLIFGTDGLWNVVTPQEAVDTVCEKEKINERLQMHCGDAGGEWTNPSKGLVERALKTWAAKKMRADNTSVVTVILSPPRNIDTSRINDGMEQNALPDSCGLEYSEICAEIPTQDQAVTYKEMVEKYLPPEAYRNFNYYEDSEPETSSYNKFFSAEEDGESNTLVLKYNGTDVMYWRNASHSLNSMQAFAEEANPWGWDDKSQPVSSLRGELCTEGDNAGNNESTEIDESGDDDDDDDDDDDNDVDDDEDKEETKKRLPNGNVTDNYTQYIGDMPAQSLHCTANNQRSQDLLSSSRYLNSFAESYNSLLSEQMCEETAAGSSNSSPACQSISGTRMHEILQEQQLYQQQCMSEEEGYSLTKLETRREQQRCSGVQTFKIFQTNESPTSGNADYAQSAVQLDHSVQSQNDHHMEFVDKDLEEAMTWEPSCPPLSAAMTRFLAYQQQHQQQQQQTHSQKPLELNSLLQQEREEEQQVALERLEMQRHLATTASHLSITNSNSSVDDDNQYVNGGGIRISQDVPESLDETLVEEYLEDEIEVEEEKINVTVTRVDASVQINEVTSSSITDSTDVFVKSSSSNMSTVDTDSLHSDGLSLASSGAIVTDRNSTTKMSQSPATTSAFHVKPCPGRTSLRRSQTHFLNIPNENSQVPLSSGAYTLRKCRRFNNFAKGPTNSASNSNTTSPRSSGSNCSEKRQLRSSSNIDYSKYTLRTRNCLTKDMKAKCSLAATMKRATAQFLHTTAVSLMNGLAQQRTTTRVGNPPTSDCNRKQKTIKQSLVSTASTISSTSSRESLSHVINLRSRQVGQYTEKSKAAAASHRKSETRNNSSLNSSVLLSRSASPTTRMSKAERRERRNRRSITGHSSRCENGVINNKDTQGASGMCFSKSMRSQVAPRSTFGMPPPPSPKLINAVAAVAAATRARSLLTAKNTAICATATRSTTSINNNKKTSLRSGTKPIISSPPMTTRSTRTGKKLKH